MGNPFTRPKSLDVALRASLGALAASVSVGLPGLPYPLLFFLRFDLAEIVDALAFFLLGPAGALVVTVVHWFALNFSSPSVPVVGPTMKFAAILSMLLGFWLASKFIQRFTSGDKVGHLKFVGSLWAFGALIRVAIMAALTFTLYSLLLPDTYIPFGRKALAILGFPLSSDYDIVILIVALTGLFNAVHVVLTLIPSYVLAAALQRYPQILAMNPWIGQLVRPSPISQGKQIPDHTQV